MPKVYFSGKPGKGFSGSHARATEGGCPRSPAPQGEWVALLGMKSRRAPLPVSPSLKRAFISQGLAEDPAELGHLVRSYLFLVDAPMLLAESRKRPALFVNSLELAGQLQAAKQTQSETGAQYPWP